MLMEIASSVLSRTRTALTLQELVTFPLRA